MIARLCLLPSLVALLTAPWLAAQEAPQAMGSIASGDLKRHLEILASDAYGGRLTGTADQIKTAQYIAKHFESLDLKPWGSEDQSGKRGWLQEYPVTLTEVLEGSGLCDGEKPLHRHGAWMAISRRTARAWSEVPGHRTVVEAPLKFLGDLEDDRIEHVGDLSGTIPVVVVDPRQKLQRRNVMFAMMAGQRVIKRITQARNRLRGLGARGCVVLMRECTAPYAVMCNSQNGIYPGKPTVALGHKKDRTRRRARTRIPTLVLTGDDAKAVLEKLRIPAEVAFGRKVNTRFGEATEGALTLRLGLRVRHATAPNVVACLPGRDMGLDDEALVFSAHMDHVGMGPDGQPFNGADDNGSGTSTLLEIAEAFSKLPPAERPRRSILFLSVSGEELGLWGSAHFASNPTWPTEKIIANINIDMIGRSTKAVPADMISVTPTFKLKAYNSLARDAVELGKSFGLTMTNGDRFYMRSDHYNFARKGIPVIFFCDDEHVDYHMPTDDADKIEYEKVERIARLAFLLGYRAANADERPRLLGKQEGWFGDR